MKAVVRCVGRDSSLARTPGGAPGWCAIAAVRLGQPIGWEASESNSERMAWVRLTPSECTTLGGGAD
eukprot:1102402-Prymnesium_polylepis.1